VAIRRSLSGSETSTMRCTGLVAWPEISDSSSNNSSSAAEARTSTMSASVRADPPTRRISGSDLRQQRSDSTDTLAVRHHCYRGCVRPSSRCVAAGKRVAAKGSRGSIHEGTYSSFKNARSVPTLTAPTAIENTQSFIRIRPRFAARVFERRSPGLNRGLGLPRQGCSPSQVSAFTGPSLSLTRSRLLVTLRHN